MTDESLPVDLHGNDPADLWRLSAPYMARLYIILKHSSLDLHVLQTQQGDKLIQLLEQVGNSPL